MTFVGLFVAANVQFYDS